MHLLEMKTQWFPNHMEIEMVSNALLVANISNISYDDKKISPSKGDLIYCDPPYDDTFGRYSSYRFDKDDQKNLASLCQMWKDKGCHVIISNSDTSLVRELYDGFFIHEGQGSEGC